MSRQTLFKQFSMAAVSIILTLAPPFSARAAAQSCRQLFTNTDTNIGLLRSRFSADGKPLKTPKFAAPARMVLSRYAGGGSFHVNRSHSWIFNGKSFQSEGSRDTEFVGFRDDESQLAQQQEFSLLKMVETGYLTPAQAAMFSRLGTNLQPSQTNFIEMVHDATPAEIREFYPNSPEMRFGQNHTFRAGVSSPTRPIKTAAIWSIAGQTWNKENTAVFPVPLAWEKEEARRGQALDRKKYKFVWESGRAAQDVPGDIAPLYAANALLNYIELRANKGRLEDAFIMFHSFDKVNSRLYQRMHPDSVYPKGWTDMNDCLFLIPLKDALEKYDLASASEHISKLMTLSRGKISALAALDLLIDTRLLRWSELDLRTSRYQQPSPIILNDLSLMRGSLIVMGLEPFKMESDAKEQVIDYLLGIQTLLHSSNADGRYQNAADSLLTSYQYLHQNAVEISNLDPKLADYDPNYALTVLMSSFSVYVHQMATTLSRVHHMPLEESYPKAAEALVRSQINFGVSTSFPEVESQLRRLQPFKIGHNAATKTDRPLRKDDELLKTQGYKFRDARLYFFTAKQLRDLAVRYPDFYSQAGSSLFPGAWRSQYLLSQPDLF